MRKDIRIMKLQPSSSVAHVAATIILLISSTFAVISSTAYTPGSTILLTTRVPHRPSNAVQFRASRQASSNDSGGKRRSLVVMESSLKDPSETEEAFDLENFDGALDDLHALPGVESEQVPTSKVGNNPEQNIQQILSSPKLLDPTVILNATIGINTDSSEDGKVSIVEAKDIEAYQQEFKAGLNSIALEQKEDLQVKDMAVASMQQQKQPLSNNKSIVLKNVPSIKKILRYTIPAIGIWLCSPVLSMIDTAAVGLLSGTAQQASLNPAVSISDYGALVVAFMYTATTNLIAAAVQKDKDGSAASSEQQRPRTTKTLLTALQLALVVGTIFGALVGTSGKTLLKMLVGNDTLDPAVFGAALQYVRIRSLGMPAMVVIGTAQSACLGMQDVKSPLYVLATAAAVNLVGDIFLVPRASAMFGGAAGAAWATVASQYAAMLFFYKWFTTTTKAEKKEDTNNESENHRSSEDGPQSVDITRGIMELTGTSKEGKSRRKQFHKFLTSSKLSRRMRRPSKFKSIENFESSITTADATTVTNTNDNDSKPRKQQPITRGFLSDDKVRKQNYLSVSNIKAFLPFVIPVTTTSVGRISGYIAMSHVASSTLGTFDMAAHQIIISLFCCMAPLVDALSQVAQSFVPAVYEVKEHSRERAMALRRTVNNFRKVGAGFGGLLVALVSCVPLISRFFTTDPVVLQQVNGAIPGVGLFLLVNGLMCAGEGTLLGQKDLKFLRNMYAIFFVAVPAYMLRLKHNSLAGIQAVGVGTMWDAFAIYNIIRTIIWHLRLTQLQRRTEKEVVDKTVNR